MSNDLLNQWELIIGLEIHVQLNTKTKLFSAAPNRFGDEPNVNIGVVDTGQPGTLPVLNREAVKKAVMFGVAINAEINRISRFDRKSYFYPDSPRNFQITQFEKPIIKGGVVHADVDGVSKSFELFHAHLEDDAGMLKHFTNFAGVDYNRAGVPLIEIVSKPCIHSAEEAVAYAQAVRSIMLYLDISDCNMEEGSLRMDVNISVRRREEAGYRPKVEIKNLNSFTHMKMAIEAEYLRQVRLYLSHPEKKPEDLIERATYRFDPEKKETIRMRSKEMAEDYRYFPEPDLPQVLIEQAYVDEIKRNLPELPHARYVRYTEALGLSPYNASLLVNDKPLSDYFEKALLHCSQPTALCNWITVEFVGRLKEKGTTPMKYGIVPEHIGKLVEAIHKGTITGKIAKSIADDMIASPGRDPDEIIAANPEYVPMSDTSSIEPLVESVLKENQTSIDDYVAGKAKAFNFLVGQVMKLCAGKASPDVVKELLLKKLPKQHS